MYKPLVSVLAVWLYISVFNFSMVKAEGLDKVEIVTQQVTENIYMLQGQGGNLGVSVGDDGVFLVDDQFAPLTEKIKAAISKISSQDIRFVINTHYHFDHVGGNENLGTAGAAIVAHKNVRQRMSTEQLITFFNKTIPPYPQKALPVITFSEDINFHLNDEDIHVVHVKDAHTDGDAVVFFRKANVVHTGDIYFAGIYPFIDTSSSGSIKGVIAAVHSVLKIINDQTRVIPGHGPLSNKKELARYVKMLETLESRVSSSIAQGKSLEEIQQMQPSKEFDQEWGDGFLPPHKFVQILFEDLSKNTHK